MELIVLLGIILGALIGFVIAFLIYRNRGETVRHELGNETAALAANIDSLKTNYQTALQTTSSLEQKLEQRAETLNEVATAKASLETALAETRNQLTRETSRITEIEEKLSTETAKSTGLAVRKGELETELEKERKSAEEKLKTVLEAQNELKNCFDSLSREALKTNSEAFLETAHEVLRSYQQKADGDLEKRQEGIKNLVEPVSKQLEEVRKFVHEVEKERGTAYTELKEQVAQMTLSHGQLSSTASQLVNVLSNTKSRGQWGEIQLKRVVELAGMMEHCDFEEQKHLDTKTGARRPDLVVHLPGTRTIFVDAKAPMDSYLKAHETTVDAERDELFTKHAKAIRLHVSALKAKNYHEAHDHSPDFVFLFLPNEAVFSTALEYDPKLLEDGASENVIIATPITLIALLKAAAHDWRQEKIADEVRKFSELGREFYERLATVTGRIANLGRSIDKTVTNYNSMIGSIEGRLIPTAKKFHESNMVGDSKKKLEEPPRVEHSVRSLSEMGSLEDPSVIQDDLNNLAEDFEEQFGGLTIADAAGGGE